MNETAEIDITKNKTVYTSFKLATFCLLSIMLVSSDFLLLPKIKTVHMKTTKNKLE